MPALCPRHVFRMETLCQPSDLQIIATKERTMTDLYFIGLGAVLFAGLALYAGACKWM